MEYYALIEVDDGFTIIEVSDGESAESLAATEGGRLIDPGPYASYQDAVDALDRIEILDDEVDAC